MANPRRYAALVRGVNVGGRTAISMAGLREICEAAGCTDVETYIRSGNVLLTSTLAPATLRARLERTLSERLSFTSMVVVRTGDELETLLTQNPFPKAEADRLHVAFLRRALKRPEAANASEAAVEPEELAVHGPHLYLHLPNGVGRAKTTVALERRLPVPMTIRNWRTVTKLAELLAR